MKRFAQILLVIIPVIYMLVGFYYNDLIGYLSMWAVDPEYIYFTNGLYMSLGNFDVTHIDNPGTPLQVLCALVFRGVYLFRSGDTPYILDVFQHSDMYLNVVHHVITTVVAGALFGAGLWIRRITNSILFGLLIQTAPFYTQLTYDIAGRVMPELLLPVAVLLLSGVLLKYVWQNDQIISKRTILMFAMAVAFGLSIKITAFGLGLIPLILIPTWKFKGRYVLLTMVSMLVFAFPIVNDLSFFTGWIWDLFAHSGHYGKGTTDVVNVDSFSHHLYAFWVNHPLFNAVFVGGLITALIYAFSKNPNKNTKLWLAQVAVLASVLLQAIVVAKHYQYRYLVTAFALFPVMVILSLKMWKEMLNRPWFRYVQLAVVLAGGWYMIPKHLGEAKARSVGIGTEVAARMETKHFMETLEEDAIKLMVPTGYGSPVHDFSIMISHCWAGRENNVFFPYYKITYPYSYYYFTWENGTRYYGDYDAQTIVWSSKPVYFYIDDYTPELADKALRELLQGYDLNKVERKLIFENEATKEKVFRLQFSKT